jgi:hypothetical protein
MSKDISEIANSKFGLKSHVVGHGPSLNQHLENLCTLPENEILLSVNDVDRFTGLRPDYWITSNPEYTIPTMYERINKIKNTTFIYSDVVDTTDKQIVNDLLSVPYYTFDSFHFKSQPNIFYVKGWRLGCQRGWLDCCNHIKKRLTIQELLQQISGYDKHYSTADTNILHALALSIIIGSKNINLYGVDLDYSKGYINGHLSDGRGAIHRDSFDYWLDRIQSDFYIINESAKKIGASIRYYGDSNLLKSIFDYSTRPNKVYESDCRNYD